MDEVAKVIIAPLAAILGVIITFWGSYFIMKRQHNNTLSQDRARLQQERIDLQRKDFQELLSHYVDRIDNFVSERRALILALTDPLLASQTVMYNLFPEIWKTASIADEAYIIAASFGHQELSADIRELEQLFRELWKTKSDQRNEASVETLENRTSELYEKIVKNILELRARVSRIRGSGIGRFNITDLPKLLDASETHNA